MTVVALPPSLVDTYAAAIETGDKPATIRQWVARGRLTHHGYDRVGRTLIDRHELAQLKQLDQTSDLL